MKVEGKTLRFDRTLWVECGEVESEEAEDERRVTARSEEAYVKVLNHFGRVLKLFLFEGGRWVDADTGQEAGLFDESTAGHIVPPAGQPEPQATAGPAPKASAKHSRRAASRADRTDTARRGGSEGPKRSPRRRTKGHTEAKG